MRIVIKFPVCLRSLQIGTAALLLLSLSIQGAQARSASLLRPALVAANIRVSHDTYRAHSEPAMAENPADPRDLVAGSKFFTDPAHYQFKIGTFYSSDGGKTWHDDGLLPGYDAFPQVSDISFAFSPNGSVVYACVLVHDPVSQDSGIFISRSRDGGKTWLAPDQVFLDSTGVTFSDKPWIAVDQTRGQTRGTVYVAWNLDGNSTADELDPGIHLSPRQVDVTPQQGMVVARSVDYGHTFSPPLLLVPFSTDDFDLGAIPQVGPDGRVYISYLGLHDNGSKTVSSMAMVTSSDRGVTYSQPRTIASNISALPNHLPKGTFRNLSLPTFAVSPTDSSMVLAWADKRYGDADILAARSTDRGKTWSTPVRVNHDRLHNGKDQFQPTLAVAPNGTYTCSWFDRRYDPNNRLIDVAIAQSSTDGRTWGSNLRVTRKSWDPSIDAPEPEGKSSNTFIGDYQALAVDNNAVHPLWNDTQNGVSQEIRTAVLAQRVFARR